MPCSIFSHTTKRTPEILQFRQPDAIRQYGPPFTPADGPPSTSPLLQTMFNKFALTLPGLRDVSESAWKQRCSPLIEKLGAAGLSESYDKGSIGARKTLATAVSAVIEYPARGYLGGIRKKDIQVDRDWDASSPEDVLLAWDHFIQDLIYGDRIDRVFADAAQTDKLEDHPPLVQAAHRYILVNLASFLHHTLVLSPDGAYLQRLIINCHRLVPYGLARQSLRIGNVATMMNAMMKLLLAKMSVSTLTNWIGLSKDADEGMNLLQTIISTVLHWDISDFSKRAIKIEKNKDGPTKDYLECIKEHIKKDREEHIKCRARSEKEEKSVVAIIFDEASLPELEKEQHSIAAEYLAIQLSIHDREEIINILCKSNPDILTQLIRDIVYAYEPIIRQFHNAVDLAAGMADLENFMNDFIKLLKQTKVDKKNDKEKPEPPSVEDYLELLNKHVNSTHRFLHQMCKNGAELAGWYKDYAKNVVKEFRETEPQTNGVSTTSNGNKSIAEDVSRLSKTAAGNMTEPLNDLVSKLSTKDQTAVIKTLDAYSEYLAKLQTFSNARMKSTLALNSATTFGPGAYLQRWQDLMNKTLITPLNAHGSVRTGKSESVKDGAMVDIDGGKLGERFEIKEERELPEAPEVSDVIRLCAPGFKVFLQKNQVNHLDDID